MFVSQVTAEIKNKVDEALNEKPDFMPSFLAQKLGISEAVVLAALPEDMRSFASAENFEKIWAELCKWEQATFFVNSSGAIVEYKGKLPAGKYGHGFFNLKEENNPLGGHLLVDKLAAICFVQKQLFSLESLSVQFFDKDGHQMFGVYAGREGREIIPAIKAAWQQMKGNFC